MSSIDPYSSQPPRSWGNPASDPTAPAPAVPSVPHDSIPGSSYEPGQAYAPYQPESQPQPQQQYPYGTQPQPFGSAEHPQGTTVLVLSLVGLLVFQPLLWAAWYMGAQARKQILSGATPYRWEGNVKVGYLIGKWGTIVTVGLFVLAFGLMMLVFILGGMGELSSTSPYSY